jgi:FeS assembly SUF system protein
MDDNTTGIEPAEPAPVGPVGEAETLRRTVIEAVSSVYDPEIPVNIYELGLIYDVSVSDARDVDIVMTLTSPMCPVAESLPIEVESRVRGVDDVNDVHVELTWEPPWTPEMMTEAAKLELGFM